MSSCTIQSILNQHFDAYLQHHKLPLYQLKAIAKLRVCRSAALGGHCLRCEAGHLNGIWYNSCKHRACPQCQKIELERWLVKAQGQLLDCPHHHIVFTLPHQLHLLWRFNRVAMMRLLFQAVHETLATLCRDKQYLDAMLGYLCALHTWGRSLSLHPHIHCLITDGGLDKQGQWRKPKKSCLLPARVVMALFRGKLLAKIRQAIQVEELIIPTETRQQQLNILNKLGRTKWVLHFCQRYEHGEGVAKYLARYVHSGAYNNSQLLSENDGQVRFSYTSHQSHRREVMKLKVDELISRVLEHTPLPGKVYVRRYGLYHNKCREKLNTARAYFKQQPVTEPDEIDWNDYLENQGMKLVCEQCQQPLHLEAVIVNSEVSDYLHEMA